MTSLPSGWVETALGAYIDIKHGFAFKGKYISERENGNILVTPGNFKVGGGFKSEKFKYYDGEIPKDYILEEDGIIITMTDLSKTGDTLGFPAKVPNSTGITYLHNQRIGLLQFKKKEINKEFLYWLLRTRAYQKTIVNSSTGSTVRHTSPTRVQECVLSIPKSISEQKAIAAVLSAFDEKIELLREQNKTLETLAQTIFKEWFVKFKGGESTPISELIVFNPIERIDRKIEYLFFDMKALSTNSMATSEGVFKKSNSGTSFREGDTLFAKITPCLENGKTAFVLDLKGEMIARGSTEFIVMRSRKGGSPYLNYCICRDNKFREYAAQSMTGTSGRQRVPVDRLKTYEIQCSLENVSKFNDAAKPCFEKIKNNSVQIQTLSKSRDTLLPKLMSGDIRVKYE